MNTRVSYQYRDASNYKLYDEVVIAGELSFAELEPFLIDGIYFVPEELHIPRLQFGSRNEDDHDWHEILKLEPCPDPPNMGIDGTALLLLAKQASNNRFCKQRFK